MFQHCVYPVSSFGHCCLFCFITLNCFLINYHDADVVFTWLVCFFMFLFNFNHVVIILNLFFSYYIFLIKFHHCVLVYIHMFVSHVQCFSYLFLRYPCFYMFSCLNWQEHRCMSQMSFFKVNFWTPSSYLEDIHFEMDEPLYIYIYHKYRNISIHCVCVYIYTYILRLIYIHIYIYIYV